MSNWSTASAPAMATGAAVSYDQNSTAKMMLNLRPDFSSKDHSPLAALLGSRQQHQLITPFSVIRAFDQDPNSNTCTGNAAPKRPFWPFLDDSQEETSAHEATEMLNSTNPHQQKKKRLTVEQVKSLEVSFDMDNKLEPERKQELAEKLGLQPRQVAVWFQNRRARWKTKNLEQEYTELKVQYDSMVAETKRLRSEVARLTAELEARECKEAADEPNSNSGQNSSKALDGSGEAAASPGHANCIQQQPFSSRGDPYVIRDHEKSLEDGDFQERAESISPACSDYSDIIDAGSPTSLTVDAGNHEANVHYNVQGSKLYEFEDHMCFEDQSKEETVGLTQQCSVLPTQRCVNLMDMANANNVYHHQNLLTDITTSLFNEDPNGNHISSMADWLWELT